jgi:hypothetical protein
MDSWSTYTWCTVKHDEYLLCVHPSGAYFYQAVSGAKPSLPRSAAAHHRTRAHHPVPRLVGWRPGNATKCSYTLVWTRKTCITHIHSRSLIITSSITTSCYTIIVTREWCLLMCGTIVTYTEVSQISGVAQLWYIACCSALPIIQLVPPSTHAVISHIALGTVDGEVHAA